MEHSTWTLVAAAVLASVACNTAPENGAPPSVERARPRAPLAPGDPGESEGDREITARVRNDVAADTTLSVTGRNVRIVTKNGAVTLRGPVLSDGERSRISAHARRVAGVQSVNDLLEVASN